MAGPIYDTEWVAMALTFTRGSSADVTAVGIYLDLDPNASPDAAAFTTPPGGSFAAITQLVEAPNPLAQGSIIDILSHVGESGTDIQPPAGDYQVWGLVQTADEKIVRKAGTLTML